MKGEKIYIATCWCVVLDTRINRYKCLAGHSSYLIKNYTVVELNDDMLYCQGKAKELNDAQDSDEDLELKTFACAHCGHQQDHPTICPKCSRRRFEPIWKRPQATPELKAKGPIRCGDCKKWMTQQCPKEKDKHKVNPHVLPHMNSFTCSEFVLDRQKV